MNNPNLVQASNFLSTLYQTPQRRQIITVNGVNEAKDFRLDKSESVALIDSASDVLYIKESDELGKTSLRIYECLDKTDEYLAKNTPAQISKADFETLQKQLNQLTTLLSKGGKYDVEKQKQ